MRVLLDYRACGSVRSTRQATQIVTTPGAGAGGCQSQRFWLLLLDKRRRSPASRPDSRPTSAIPLAPLELPARAADRKGMKQIASPRVSARMEDAVHVVDVLACGRPSVDLTFLGLPCLPQLGEEYHVGGFAMNPGAGFITVNAMRRLGLRTGYATDLGSDMFSRYILENLRTLWYRRNVHRAPRSRPQQHHCRSIFSRRPCIHYLGGRRAFRRPGSTAKRFTGSPRALPVQLIPCLARGL